MSKQAQIEDSQKEQIYQMYHDQQMSMQDIADELGVTLNGVVYFMRKHQISRRDHEKANEVVFENKDPSFTVKENLSPEEEKLQAMGAMLYWAEGYDTDKTQLVDFANSDPQMIKLFLKFLRNIYEIDEDKLRGFVYCYANQDVEELERFWSEITRIPEDQFTKPYVRDDYREDSRTMDKGLFHVRYADKKLLQEIRDLIQSYCD